MRTVGTLRIVLARLRIVLARRDVVADGEAVHVTPTEFQVLALASRGDAWPVSAEQTLQQTVARLPRTREAAPASNTVLQEVVRTSEAAPRRRAACLPGRRRRSGFTED